MRGLEFPLESWQGSGGPPGGLGQVGRPQGGPGGIEWPFPGAGRGQEALQEGREELGGPPEGPEWVGRPSKRVERVWETLPES